MHEVFISYSSQDKTVANAVCAGLEARGTRCWIAPRDIVAGKDWAEAIIDGIHESRAMVLIFSAHANESQQIKRELERAVSKDIPVVPVRIEEIVPAKTLEYFMSNVHWFDAMPLPIERYLDQLNETVRMLTGGTNPIKHPERPVDTRLKSPDQRRALLFIVFAVMALAVALTAILYRNGSSDHKDTASAPPNQTQGTVEKAPGARIAPSIDKTRYPIRLATPADIRMANGDLVYRVLAAEIDRYDTDDISLRFRVRLTNQDRFDVNFWDRSFRLLVDDVPRAPVGNLNELVAARSAKEGDVLFVVPGTATKVFLEINNGNESKKIPFELKAAKL